MAVKSKKKILYIITKSVWAGAGKYVYDLATNLPKDEFEVFVAAGGDDLLAQKIKEADIPYHNIRNFRRDINVFKEVGAFFEIWDILKKIKPDIVHVSSSKAAGIVGIAAFLYKFSTFNFSLLTVFTVHGWAFHEKRPFWQNLLIKLFSAITAIFYQKIICVSEFDRQSAIKNFIASPKKFITIHNGIKLDNYSFLPQQKAREQLGNSVSNLETEFPSSEMWIGTVGEFTKNKGHKYLVETAEKLKTKNLKFKILIIGWGEESENLKLKIKSLKLENEVFLIDNLTPAAPYLKAFDIFVLPSLKEGFPYVLLEAAAAPLAVVANSVGGVPEIIENEKTGLLVNAGNADELAKSIEKLIANPKLREMLSQGLWQKSAKDFNFEKMLIATLVAYK